MSDLIECSQCKKAVPSAKFGPRERERAAKKLACRCRACTNAAKYIQRHGLKRAEYDAMLAKQEGACARCCVPFGRDLPVIGQWPDKRVHGLLCKRCDTGIRMLGGTVSGCLGAAVYLTHTLKNASPVELEAIELFAKQLSMLRALSASPPKVYEPTAVQLLEAAADCDAEFGAKK